MKNQITITPEQLHQFMVLTNGILDYQDSNDGPQEYVDFLSGTFGENWDYLMGEWDDLYYFEFEVDAYLYLVSGVKTKGLDDWINQGKEILELILKE